MQNENNDDNFVHVKIDSNDCPLLKPLSFHQFAQQFATNFRFERVHYQISIIIYIH